MAGTARRCALGEPWFLVAVAVLALNDQVWKADQPGWVTGKVSDVAGVVVVGAVAAALVGRRLAVVGTAVAFVALKTVPGVAELAAPLLGGVTRRDPTDLLALLALLPLSVLLGRRDGTACGAPDAAADRGAPDRYTIRAENRPRALVVRRMGRVASSLLPILGAASALVVTTATSCDPDPAVVRVVAQGASTYAFVDRGFDGDRWARSDDGGRSWRRSEAPSGVDPDAYAGIPTTTTTTTDPLAPGADPTLTPTTEPDPGGPDGAVGSLESCAETACYRIVDGGTLQRAAARSDQWVTEAQLSSADRDRITTGCSGPQERVLSSIAAGDGSTAVASLGAAGVLARNGDGTWSRHRVLDAGQGSLAHSFVTSWAFWAVAGAAPLGMAAAWVLSRPRSLLRIIALIVIPVGVLAVCGWVFSVAFVLGDDPRFERAHIIATLAVVVLGLSLAIGSRQETAVSAAGPPRPPQDPRPNPPAPSR